MTELPELEMTVSIILMEIALCSYRVHVCLSLVHLRLAGFAGDGRGFYQ